MSEKQHIAACDDENSGLTSMVGIKKLFNYQLAITLEGFNKNSAKLNIWCKYSNKRFFLRI